MQEQVDDVQVEVDGGQDVLLGGELLHQHVGVVDDEATEDQSAGSSHDQLCAVAVEEELQGAQSQHEEGEQDGQCSSVYAPKYLDYPDPQLPLLGWAINKIW